MGNSSSPDQLLAEIAELQYRVSELQQMTNLSFLETRSDEDQDVRFRALAESAVDAIICADENDSIILWNPAAARIFGYGADEALGRSVEILIPDHLKEAHRQGVKRYLATGEPRLLNGTVELVGLRKGSQQFPLELSLSTWSSGGKRFFTAIIRDNTDRKASERELKERTEEARQRTEELHSFVQMVAHDLKSPVVTMGGMVRALQKRIDTAHNDERTHQIMEHILTSARTIEDFLNDLLDELSADRGECDRERICVDRIAREVVESHQELAQEHGVLLEYEGPRGSEALVVWGDKRRIGQVVDNLVVNAIKHMGRVPVPHVKVRAFENADRVVIEVRDNGLGIPEEFQWRVFEHFYRVPKENGPRGTGLGLAIVKKIVEDHGGSVSLQSRPHEATVFTCSFPRHLSTPDGPETRVD